MVRKFCLSFVGCCILLLGSTSVRCEPHNKLETSRFPSLISSIRIDAPLDFCGEAVPLDNPEVRERLEKELLLTLWNRSQVILWLKRSGRYFPHIEKVLKENHAPDDLKYVPVIESALRPHAVSSKRAVGFWQFIRATGRKYDLKINTSIDERRNVFASTRAAAFRLWDASPLEWPLEDYSSGLRCSGTSTILSRRGLRKLQRIPM